MPIDLDLPISKGSARAPRKRRVKRVRRERITRSRGRGSRLVKIKTVTERIHADVGKEGSKETIHKSKGKLPMKRKESLIKAMRAAIKSPRTPEHLKAGLRRKLREWTSS